MREAEPQSEGRCVPVCADVYMYTPGSGLASCRRRRRRVATVTHAVGFVPCAFNSGGLSCLGRAPVRALARLHRFAAHPPRSLNPAPLWSTAHRFTTTVPMLPPPQASSPWPFVPLRHVNAAKRGGGGPRPEGWAAGVACALTSAHVSLGLIAAKLHRSGAAAGHSMRPCVDCWPQSRSGQPEEGRSARAMH